MTAPLITGLIILAVLSLAGAAMAIRRGANGSAVLSLIIPLYGAFYLLRTAKEG
jgi:ABC-type enterochelin transport system permease subunit